MSQNQPGRPFEFTPGAGAPHVKRRVRFNIPQQASGKALHISADPLPTETIPAPPPSKGIQKIIRLVMEPRVQVEGASETVTEFDPPLAVTIDFDADDVQAIPGGASGKPRLSIFSCYKDGNTWKFERLATTVTTGAGNSGTLTASVKTLRPGDPIGLGYP